MSKERSFTTAFGSYLVEIRFAEHESSTLMLESTDFLVPASSVETPDFVVHVQTAGKELFPMQYTVAQETNSLVGMRILQFQIPLMCEITSRANLFAPCGQFSVGCDRSS